MLKRLLIAMGCVASCLLSGTEKEQPVEAVPTYLYKILSVDDWEKSQHMEHIKVPIADNDCIHFSMENQVDTIIKRYWSNIPQFFVLKVDTNKLIGNLVFEVNPGGTTKYYHLYDGAIPLSAVVEYKLVNN